MSEWPKWIRPDALGEVKALNEEVEVIPADLGRELVEAIQEVRAAFGVQTRKAANKRLDAALSRYEQEAGDA